MLCTREVTVQVPDGLHHQTAARFIQTANRFTSVVRVVYGDNNVNAKSLLGVLSLSIGAGTRITITADGADAGEALDALEQCLAGACAQLRKNHICRGTVVFWGGFYDHDV